LQKIHKIQFSTYKWLKKEELFINKKLKNCLLEVMYRIVWLEKKTQG